MDFFAALAEAGVSRRRSAVPAGERDPRAWFAQVGMISIYLCIALFLHYFELPNSRSPLLNTVM